LLAEYLVSFPIKITEDHQSGFIRCNKTSDKIYTFDKF